ncbi:MAG: glycosyltransferase family 4 protein [Chloroflexi bacterium]|nr:glycosyltransferase family 4 protein [Chloroflexota bacterium]
MSTRVLMLTQVFPRARDDSMGAFVFHIADALAARDIAVEVIAPHAPKLADEETFGPVRVHRFRYAPARWERLAYAGTMHELVARGIANKILFACFLFAFVLKTISVARAARPRILHAHWWLPGGLIGALASMLTRASLVITTHGTDVELLRRTRWARPLARFVFARARAITCGSTYLCDQLRALDVVDARRLVVISEPVAPLFENVPTTTRNPSRTILAVARLTAQKSIDTLLDALALVPDARLKIIGDGPERATLQNRARKLNLQDRVTFLGALPPRDLPAQYADCALFALPSIREGFGIVFAEALLCGAPVIATNTGGAVDIVRDGETGLLVPERDPRALADAIQKLLDDPALATRLATNGAAYARAHFTRDQIAAQFEKIYNGTRTNADERG